jgi:four helix bundle protein
MILDITHKNLTVYKVARQIVKECYKISYILPSEERFNLIQQIRRAGLSIALNIAEGASRKSALERKRFYEIARGSVIEIDTALEVSIDLEYFNEEQFKNVKPLLNSCFSMLSKMIKTLSI